MTYKLYKTLPVKSDVDAVMKLNENGSMSSFLFDPANTDYTKFKADLANGVALEDATGTAMTADQIKSFMETLP